MCGCGCVESGPIARRCGRGPAAVARGGHGQAAPGGWTSSGVTGLGLADAQSTATGAGRRGLGEEAM